MRASRTEKIGRDGESPGQEPVPGYRLLARVGSGGAGEVWSAEAPGGLRVALKIVRLTEGLGRRELANLRILRAIRHPNLLAYFGAWQHRERLIIGMELADGSLWDRLAEARGRGLAGIPRGELLEIIGEVAKVLDFLNAPCHVLDGRPGLAIHHRDIKPQNIMLIGRGVKVADFGLSCLDEPGPAAASRSQGGLTFAYAAPEVFRREVATSSDQYSLAVTYCHLRGGRLPFVGPPAAVMMAHLLADPDLSMLPAPERPIIGRALAKDPSERWPDCRSLVRELADRDESESPDELPGGLGRPGAAFESSGSVMVPPFPDAWEGSGSPSAGLGSMESGADVSAYCLPCPVPPDDPGAVGVDEGSASPTVVMAGLRSVEPHSRFSRLGLVAASILAAGLVAWSGSERIATRADIPPAILTTALTPPPIRSAAPLPPPRPLPIARPTGPLLRSLADSSKALMAARLAEISAWKPRILEATATARTWLTRLATTRRPSPPPTAIAPARPTAVPGSPPASPPAPIVGIPDVLEIEAGRSVSIPIRVNRAGHDEPLCFHFEGLPAGVSIPDITIPAGQDRAQVTVRARLDAAATTAPVAISVRAGSTRAEARLRVRVRENPARLHRTRGHTLLACGRYTEAVAAFTEAIRAGVTDACVYHHRGLAYSALNQLGPAIRDFNDAIRIGPTDAAIRYDRAMAFIRQGQDFRALLDLDAAIRLRPDDIRAYEARARIYRKHGDVARSDADIGRAGAIARAARDDGRRPAPRPPQAGAAR